MQNALVKLEVAAQKSLKNDSTVKLTVEVEELRERCKMLEDHHKNISHQLDDTIIRMRELLGLR